MKYIFKKELFVADPVIARSGYFMDDGITKLCLDDTLIMVSAFNGIDGFECVPDPDRKGDWLMCFDEYNVKFHISKEWCKKVRSRKVVK